MKRLLFALGCLPFLWTLAGCGGAPRHAWEEGRIRVTATTGMVGDLVENVGGERVHVITLMPPGVDPHVYKAKESDIALLEEADVVFYNGLNLEGRMGSVLERLARSRREVVAVGDGVDRSLLHRPPEFEGQYDPHIWFDVSMWAQALGPVVDALSEFDPENSREYEENAESYRQQLLALHEYCRERIAAIPRGRRVLVTAHDAFGYFGHAYDIEVVGLQGISTAAEYSVDDVRRVVALISQRGVPAIFAETSVNERAIRAVVEGCAARGYEVAIGGWLYSDAMGEPGTPAGTYLGMVRHNVETIVDALR